MSEHYTKTAPAADRLRPKTFDDMAGQEELVGKNGVLRRLCAAGRIPNMIFFGPPGTGKTTAAAILAESSNMTLRRLNATTASLADVKAVAAETGGLFGQSGILLYLDEIQYFNKKQQQSLLEYIEDGRITLIASTTENPYFYIYDALLSRCNVFEFKHVTAAQMLPKLKIAADELCRETDISFDDGVLEYIAGCAAGDVRRAVTMTECAVQYVKGASECGDDAKEKKLISADMVKSFLPSVMAGNFDRDGNVHYDLLSALQKSIRGSDPDAAVFYLARLLEGGDIISPCRRLLVIASEDIGAAYPMAAVITKACVDSARELGLPEAAIPLANAAVMLATAPKSNSAYLALDAALADIKNGLGTEIPVHLQSPLYKGYKYPHNYPDRYVPQQYLPDDVKDKKYYRFADNKAETAAREYWERIKKESPGKKN